MSKLSEIEGIGEAYTDPMSAAGITSLVKLLAGCADPKGRQSIAEKTRLADQRFLKRTNREDLPRIQGVDRVPDLAQDNAQSLQVKRIEVNHARKMVRQVPSEIRVSGWVEQPKSLPGALRC